MCLPRVLIVWRLSLLVHHGWAQRRKSFGCQRAWSLTFKDLNKFGYLKRIDLFYRPITKPEEGIEFLIVGALNTWPLIQECSTQSTPMAMMVMIVSHSVIMPKARSKDLVSLHIQWHEHFQCVASREFELQFAIRGSIVWSWIQMHILGRWCRDHKCRWL